MIYFYILEGLKCGAAVYSGVVSLEKSQEIKLETGEILLGLDTKPKRAKFVYLLATACSATATYLFHGAALANRIASPSSLLLGIVGFTLTRAGDYIISSAPKMADTMPVVPSVVKTEEANLPKGEVVEAILSASASASVSQV
jgi:hypothetical protein